MLELRLGEWICEAQCQRDQYPPQHRTNGIAPGRAGLIEAHSTINGPGQTISSRPIYGILPQEAENHDAQQGPYSFPRRKRQEEEGGVQRNKDGDRNQKTKQQLARRTGILESFISNLRVGPQIPPDIGRQPEAVDSKCEHQQYGAAGKKNPKRFAMTGEPRHGRGHRRAGLRRGRIGSGHVLLPGKDRPREFTRVLWRELGIRARSD